MTRIIGLDPGLETIGWSVLDIDKDKYTLVTSGVIKTKSGEPMQFRLNTIYEDVETIIEDFAIIKPAGQTVIAIEKLFYGTNVSSAMVVAQGRGVILAALGKWLFPIHEYAPTTIKKVVTGHGAAKKAAIRAAIKKQLGVDIKEDNACDGAAIALCHALMM